MTIHSVNVTKKRVTAMLLLNNREFQRFETTYQNLQAHPEWKMENIFYKKSDEREEFKRCSRLFYTRTSKLNRLNVATHEAGHAIVMAATHKRIAEAKIDVKDHPEGWIGFVAPEIKDKDASDSQSMEQKEEILYEPMVIIGLLVSAAGFVGESFCGKKVGSNHEKFLIYCRTRFLDDVIGAKPLTNWAYYIDWCRNIILNNENLFWRITDDLLKNSELSNEGKTLLHDQIKKEPSHKFL